MSQYVVDLGVVLHLLSEDIDVSEEHRLVAPTLLRSQVLDALYAAVRTGELAEEVARERLTRFARMKVRYLGDAVLRRRAWIVADELGWDSTHTAEYIALTQLQADAFITLDDELAREVAGLVAVVAIEALA